MKILLIDDHPIFRSGIVSVLQDLDDDIDCLEVPSCEEALRLINNNTEYELVLLDLNLPGIDGITGLAKLREASPATPVVILSATENITKIKTALNAGAMGYIPKSAGRDIILNAVRLVLSGGVYIPPNMLQATPSKDVQHRESVAETLTARQHEVLRLLVRGRSNKEIAYNLGMAENTVRVHVAAILKFLNVKNRTEAGYAASRLNLLEDAD